MVIFHVLVISTFAVLANAAYFDIGYCPPLPPVVTPFDVEKVNVTVLCGPSLDFTLSFSSTRVIGSLNGQRQSLTYLKDMNARVLSMEPLSREPTM